MSVKLPASAGEAEVGDADAAVRVEHDVGRLEIAVQHAEVVRGGEAGADLARDLGGPLLGEAADPLQQQRQVLAVDQLHRQEHAAVVLADVVDAADVAVRHLARDAHLVVELRQPLRILGDGRRQELQRDVLAEAQILGAVDLAHAAAADQAEDAVALGQQRARRERLAGRRQLLDRPAGRRDADGCDA